MLPLLSTSWNRVSYFCNTSSGLSSSFAKNILSSFRFRYMEADGCQGERMFLIFMRGFFALRQVSCKGRKPRFCPRENQYLSWRKKILPAKIFPHVEYRWISRIDKCDGKLTLKKATSIWVGNCLKCWHAYASRQTASTTFTKNTQF